MDDYSTPDIKRTKLVPHQRTISPRLNQLLQLFQSKSQEQTPKCLFKRDGEFPEERNRPTVRCSSSVVNNNISASFDGIKQSNHLRGYPNYNSSLKRSVDLDTRLSITPNSDDKTNPHSWTPYSRVTPSKNRVLSRQKSFQRHSIPTETNYELREESPAEQLKSVNFLLKGSKSSSRQESKDQGYSTDTSIKSSENINERLSQENADIKPERNVKAVISHITVLDNSQEDALGDISRRLEDEEDFNGRDLEAGVQAKTTRETESTLHENSQDKPSERLNSQVNIGQGHFQAGLQVNNTPKRYVKNIDGEDLGNTSKRHERHRNPDFDQRHFQAGVHVVQVNRPRRPVRSVEEKDLSNTPRKLSKKSYSDFDQRNFQSGVKVNKPRRSVSAFEGDTFRYTLKRPEPSLDELMEAKLDSKEAMSPLSRNTRMGSLDKGMETNENLGKKDHVILSESQVDAVSYTLKRPEPSLDELMKGKLDSNGAMDHLSRKTPVGSLDKGMKTNENLGKTDHVILSESQVDALNYTLKRPEPSLDELMKGTLDSNEAVDHLSRKTTMESVDKGMKANVDLDKEDHVMLRRDNPSLDELVKIKLNLDEEVDHIDGENDAFNRKLSDPVNLYQSTESKDGRANEELNKHQVDGLTNKSPVKNTPFDRRDRRISTGDMGSFRARSLTDSSLKRRPLSRSRSNIIMRPPRKLCVSESERGIQLDDNGVLQIMNDIKGMKTCLLKLKRELQEAPLRSPLSTLSAGSQRFFDDSFLSPSSTMSFDDVSSSESGPRKLVRRTTVDSSVLKRMRNDALDAERKGWDERYSPFIERTSGNVGDNLEGFPPVERLHSVFEENKSEDEENVEQDDNYKEKNEELEKELTAVKNEVHQLRQERNCHMIAREELEHELDSKNYTIKLLQTQLEGQAFHNEVDKLKEQVERLKAQVKTQQNEIFRLVQNGMSPSQPDTSSKSKSYWTELRIKLKDAMINTVQTTAHYYSTPETIKTLKTSEKE